MDNDIRIGVYLITNHRNGRKYVGSTVTGFTKRWKAHISLLNSDYHPNIHLQRAWNKYGRKWFEFSVLEVCSKENCLVREQYFIDKFDSFKQGYNRRPEAASCHGFKHSEETTKKMSQSRLGMKASPEAKASISRALKGKKKSETHRQNIWKNRQGWKHSEESKAKTSATLLELVSSGKHFGWKAGDKHSEEAKEKMSKARKGKAKSAEHRAKIGEAIKAFHRRRLGYE